MASLISYRLGAGSWLLCAFLNAAEPPVLKGEAPEDLKPL